MRDNVWHKNDDNKGYEDQVFGFVIIFANGSVG